MQAEPNPYQTCANFLVPNDLSSGQNCPNFEKFLAVMAEKLESLQGLKAEQLQQPTPLARWDEREP